MPRSAPESGLACLRRALGVRVRSPAGERPLMLPVAGGAGALLPTRACRHLVSVLDPDAVATGRGVRSWLERRQARRSALLLVPDRDTGMRFTGRWRLDLARIRAVPDLHRPPRDEVRRWLEAAPPGGGAAARPWHAA
jgi:hypothetical protein